MKEIKVVVKEENKIIETKEFDTWKAAVWNTLDELLSTYDEYYDDDELCFEDAENAKGIWCQPDGVNFWINISNDDEKLIKVSYKIVLDKVYDRIAKNLKINFENDWLNDNYDTDTAVTKENLSECSEEEIEECKMDWIHSIKENFLSVAIDELTKEDKNKIPKDEFYELFYEDVFNYLINKTFKERISKMKLSKKLIKKIKSIGFSVKEYEDEYYFSQNSPAGQDFGFYINKTNIETIDDLAYAVYERYENYDCSEEAYIWLDNTGHGTNGAPYDMKDVYEDMEACEQYILDLYELLEEER